MTQTIRSQKSLPPLTPDDRLVHIPYSFRHTSAKLGWQGLRVEYNSRQPASEVVLPPLECLWVVLTGETFPEGTNHRCDDARHQGDGLPHAVNVLPPGVESRWRWRNTFESTHCQLSPSLIAKVAQEAFDLDPARVQFPVRYYDRSCPEVINTLTALRHELLADGPGGRLCAESLANVLVVQLIRHMSNRRNANDVIRRRRTRARLAKHTFQAVEEYIHAHLDQNIALADLAAVAHLSEFHFARLFKQTTGLPPHQFVLQQRIERAKQLILAGKLLLAQIAIKVGFSDQSQLNRHFKKHMGVTPSQFA